MQRLAEPSDTIQYFEDEYDDMLVYEDSYDDPVTEIEPDDDWEIAEPRSPRWTLRRVVLMVVVLAIIAAVVVFVVLPYIDSIINPAPALHLPTPVQT